MDHRKPLDLTAIGLMIFICVIWAMQQIGLKATESYAPSVLQIGIRSGLAAACLYALTGVQQNRPVFWGMTAALGAVAGLFFSLEFFLIGKALQYSTASHVVVFLYTAPVFAALGLHLKLPTERLSPVQWGGIVVAVIGIAYAFLMSSEVQAGATSSAPTLMGDAMALAAAAVWGATTVLIRTTRLSDLPATHVLFYQLSVTSIVLIVIAVLTQQIAVIPSAPLFWNLAFQTIIVAFASFLCWFWMLTRYKASQLGVFSFLTPLFGVILGAFLLHEPLTTPFLTGSAGVLIGIITVSASPWIGRILDAHRHRNTDQGIAA
ncbi:DMT family transporter [uncultured Cohaesibacter sp.]|uniref:DMT family transporter n=1 Tax=uncultured Cohaesibacter sp. TaxID=1002546 RepID=UPI0029C93F01|nr:DMT family transporter [uncultured Cohaesibacter sp.]